MLNFSHIAHWKKHLNFAVMAFIFAALTGNTPVYANSRVAITVNNGVITSYQLENRIRLLGVTGFKGNARERATTELIEEELIFQEGRRLELKIDEPQVKRAFASIAQQLKLNSKQFEAGLRQRGVDPESLKSRLRSQVAWRDIVVGRTRATNRTPQRERDITSILFNRGSEEKNKKVKELILEQYIFVVKRDASKSVVKQRAREAETFRRKHTSCAAASENARSLKGIVVKKLGRFTEETLSPAIRQEVLNTPTGGFTKPTRGELGIGFVGVCEERVVVDNSATKDFNTGQLDTKELTENSEKWLKEIKDRADIKKRL